MKNYRKKAILYFSLIIGIINFSNMNNNYIYSIESNIIETCDCSTDNSEYYVVSTESNNLNVNGLCSMAYLTPINNDIITEDIYLSILLMENQEDYTLKLVNVTDTQNITWISQNTDDVSLKTPILGDCNNDNIISTMDLLILKKYIFGVSNDISNADINMDNNINIIDIIELKQQLITNDLSNQDENIGKYYLTSNLNIRENAGTEYQSYGIVDKYTLINVIETKTTNDGVLWGKYEYNDNIGWSSLKYATKLKVTGTTSNGFPIYQADGLTYINDLLIVNKTYSVPSTYVPTNNTLTTQTDNAFISMQKDAAKIGLNLYISSGYRSYSYQQSLYQRYVDSDGQEKADTYSARAGHSEHQTGLCFDLNTINDSFANTTEGIWVSENCHKYGFIVRYPKDKQNITGYKYEPWHLRYVGVEFATELYNSNLTIEEYFGITSEY